MSAISYKREILDEVYMTVNEDLGTEWAIQFSSQTLKEKCGFFRLQKGNKNDKYLYYVGAAHYMFVFKENDGRIGTFLNVIPDELFAPDKKQEYQEHINALRIRVQTKEQLVDPEKIIN